MILVHTAIADATAAVDHFTLFQFVFQLVSSLLFRISHIYFLCAFVCFGTFYTVFDSCDVVSFFILRFLVWALLYLCSVFIFWLLLYVYATFIVGFVGKPETPLKNVNNTRDQFRICGSIHIILNFYVNVFCANENCVSNAPRHMACMAARVHRCTVDDVHCGCGSLRDGAGRSIVRPV